MPPFPKRSAEGFEQDAQIIIENFVSEGNLEFPTFVEKWKEGQYYAVYMGRERKEMNEFTNEVFRIALKQLDKPPSLDYQVGALYLLYCLYLNQLLDPPVRPRITLQLFTEIKKIMDFAIEKDIKTLSYVIDFLLENSFFVAEPTMLGPLANSEYKTERGMNNQVGFALDDFVEYLQGFENSVFEEMEFMLERYDNALEKLPYSLNSGKLDAKGLHTLKLKFRNLISQGTGNYTVNERGELEGESIGSKRTRLKDHAFAHRALFRYLDSDDEDEEFEIKTDPDYRRPSTSTSRGRGRGRGRGGKRGRKSERRAGRPRKIEQLDEEDIDGLTDLQNYKPAKKRGPVARRSVLDCFETPLCKPKTDDS